MQINRHTYEEFFLLYVDNELNDEERNAVEDFIILNPDLEAELRAIQQSVLEPQQHIVFGNKRSLYKNAAPVNPVNEANYEEYFVLYSDEELNEDLRDCVKQFIEEHPEYQQAFDLALTVKLEPDMQIVFPDKQILYRNENETPKLVPTRWWRIAAAAVVLLSLGSLGWYYSGNRDNAQQKKPVIADKTASGKAAGQPKPPANAEKRLPASRSESSQPRPATAAASTNKKQKIGPPATRKARPKQAKETGPIPETEPKTDPEQNDLVLKTPEPADFEPDLVENPQRQQPVETAIAGKRPDNSDMIAALSPPDTGTGQKTESNDRKVIYIANTSVSKNNKLRGLFRTASRIIEKATNLEPPSKKHGFRVANVEIALQ